MILVNGETYPGQYAWDGWVDSLEPTRSMTVICFLSQVHGPKKTILIVKLITHKTKRYWKLFRTENRVDCIFSEFIIDLRYHIFIHIFVRLILAITTCNLSAFVWRDAVHFCFNMQYSKALKKQKVKNLCFVLESFGLQLHFSDLELRLPELSAVPHFRARRWKKICELVQVAFSIVNGRLLSTRRFGNERRRLIMESLFKIWR